MDIKGKATKIDLFNFSTRPMRAFHMTWFSFFLCFFAWFGIAPLMTVIREEFSLSKEQIGNIIIASVAITILARLFIGWLCDRIGPRLTYTALLTFGSLPVMMIGLSNSYETFLIARLAIGIIGASFVITQYHTSVMFAPNCVGTANATSAGWGNLGGGVTQMIMPLIFAAYLSFGFDKSSSWRLSMMTVGIICFVTGLLYYKVTTDLPEGDFKELKKAGKIDTNHKDGTFLKAASDYRVWCLFLIYAACFGIELTINNIAALYFTDYFGLGIKSAGLVAGLFGLMNLFARTLGGVVGDKMAAGRGLKGRTQWLFMAVFIEGIALLFFSKMSYLPVAIGVMIIFSLFVQMSEGATYSVVPFINKKAIGSVSGIVGAGGNLGAVSAGFLFRRPDLPWNDALFILGFIVIGLSFVALIIKFTEADEKNAQIEFERATKEQAILDAQRPKKERWTLLPIFSEIRPIDVLRIYIGAALMIKGIYFILDMDAMEKLTGNLGFNQHLIAWYTILAHCIGGATLMLGLATRLSALINVPVLIGATALVHSFDGIFGTNHDIQFSILVLVTLITLSWNGSGKFSLDQLLRRKLANE